MSCRDGFTLIELLVVIAVIALLAAVMMPVFAQAREKARQTNCLSNLRQIGIGWAAYSHDNDEGYCPAAYTEYGPTISIHYWCTAYRPSTTQSSANVWDPMSGILYPYLRSQPVQDCPTAADLPPGNFPIGYGVNMGLYTFNATITEFVPETDARTEVPAETILMADAARFQRTQRAVLRMPMIFSPAHLMPPYVHGRHAGLANVLWLDGHVKVSCLAYRTSTIGGISAQTLNANRIGALVPPHCRLGDIRCENHYYTLKK
ncbi:MAG: prepilin-type N-terminal cleavage/methylation domain-containing protein [Akkermansiaceae bacterium]|nr:prepilin-type N-terminal cleavage/methylation domain-containing protein [Armatimonadota bacterium]